LLAFDNGPFFVLAPGFVYTSVGAVFGRWSTDGSLFDDMLPAAPTVELVSGGALQNRFLEAGHCTEPALLALVLAFLCGDLATLFALEGHHLSMLMSVGLGAVISAELGRLLVGVLIALFHEDIAVQAVKVDEGHQFSLSASV
jgi:hypothetical protein